MIYLFDKDEKLIKIIRKPAIKTALQKYSLTKERYVSDRLTVEMKSLDTDELEKVEYPDHGRCPHIPLFLCRAKIIRKFNNVNRCPVWD